MCLGSGQFLLWTAHGPPSSKQRAANSLQNLYLFSFTNMTQGSFYSLTNSFPQPIMGEEGSEPKVGRYFLFCKKREEFYRKDYFYIINKWLPYDH